MEKGIGYKLSELSFVSFGVNVAPKGGIHSKSSRFITAHYDDAIITNNGIIISDDPKLRNFSGYEMIAGSVFPKAQRPLWICLPESICKQNFTEEEILALDTSVIAEYVKMKKIR